MTRTAENQPTGSHLTSRRTFLSRSSAVVAGTALGGDIAARAYAAGDETIKMALIGCGRRGTGAACQALNTKVL